MPSISPWLPILRTRYRVSNYSSGIVAGCQLQVLRELSFEAVHFIVDNINLIQ